jgi:hypothetical protein
MAVSVRGDFHKLKAWKALFDKAPELLKPMSNDMAEELLGFVQDGFRSQADPYGDGWPAKKVDDGRSILVGKTTRLRRGWHTERVGNRGFVIAPSVFYAIAHQDPKPRPKWGGKRLPRRAMVPYRGLPDKWQRALSEIANDHMHAHFTSSKSPSTGRSFVKAKLAGLKRKTNAMALVKRALREVQGD